MLLEKKNREKKRQQEGLTYKKRKLSKTSGIEEIHVCCSGPLRLATFRFGSARKVKKNLGFKCAVEKVKTTAIHGSVLMLYREKKGK